MDVHHIYYDADTKTATIQKAFTTQRGVLIGKCTDPLPEKPAFLVDTLLRRHLGKSITGVTIKIEPGSPTP